MQIFCALFTDNNDNRNNIFGISLGTSVCSAEFHFITIYVNVGFLLQCKNYEDVLPKIIHAID